MFWDNLKHWNFLFFLLKHVLLEISSEGILSGGILERGDIVRGDIVLGGYCPGGYCPGDIVTHDDNQRNPFIFRAVPFKSGGGVG